MYIQRRHWLDYDPVALAVLVIGIAIIELLALIIWPIAAIIWPIAATRVKVGVWRRRTARATVGRRNQHKLAATNFDWL
jgi:hypothetical protein